VRAALALGCDVQPLSTFARKALLLPDLPKGYQILAVRRAVREGRGRCRWRTVAASRARSISRAFHMEEDAAKNIPRRRDHRRRASRTSTWNRAGARCARCVSEPQIHTPEEAGAYLRSLRQVLRYLDVSDADMEKGQFRATPTGAVRRVGDAVLGTRTELKNLNSFRFVERAIAHEIERRSS